MADGSTLSLSMVDNDGVQSFAGVDGTIVDARNKHAIVDIGTPGTITLHCSFQYTLNQATVDAFILDAQQLSGFNDFLFVEVRYSGSGAYVEFFLGDNLGQESELVEWNWDDTWHDLIVTVDVATGHMELSLGPTLIVSYDTDPARDWSGVDNFWMSMTQGGAGTNPWYGSSLTLTAT